MRRLFAVPFLFLFAGCPAPWGYHVDLTVTVPPEVQARVSPANPGILMASRRGLAVVCQPSDVPFSVPVTDWIGGDKCNQWAAGYEEMFVVRLSDSDAAWFSTSHPKLPLCGQSGPITAQKTIDAVYQRAISGGWGPEGNETIANGVGGGCDDAGNYTGTIEVKLLNP